MQNRPVEWLQSVSRSLTGCDLCATRLEVTRTIARPKSNIFLCRLSCTHASLECCLKEFTSLSKSDFLRLTERGALVQEEISPNELVVPRFLAYDLESRSIAMTFLHGESVEARIVRSFVLGRKAQQACRDILERLASKLVTLHSIRLDPTAAFARTCDNSEYVRRLDRVLADEFVLTCLTVDGKGPKSVLEAVPDAFWRRHEARHLHGDFQAKNVLVGEDRELRMIDLSYGHGNPLFDVAQFLVQLVRLHRRWPIPGAARLVREYGNTFLDSYFIGDMAYLRPDLPFFLLWANAYSLMADKSYPTPIRAYIRSHLKHTDFARGWSS